MCETDEPTSSYKILSPDFQNAQSIRFRAQETGWLSLQRLRRAIIPKEKLTGTIQLGLTHVQHLYSRRGRTEAYAAIAAMPKPYGAVLATLPALEPEAVTSFALQHIAPGSTIITGGASCFDGLVSAGFNHVRDTQGESNDSLWKPAFVAELAKNLDAYMEMVHHAQVSESNLAEFFAEYSFRRVNKAKSVGRRFFTLLSMILK